jgi:anti-sigma factor RsiW
MRGHRQTQQLLAVYDDLTVEEKRRVESHLQGCQECAATLAAYRAMDDVVHGMVQAKLSQVAVKPALQWQAIDNTRRAGRRSSTLDEEVRYPAAQRHYGLRLAGAVVLLFLLMMLSALFGGWGPFEEPVLASTPTVEHQRVATAPATWKIEATPVAWIDRSEWQVAGLAVPNEIIRLATPAPTWQ